MRGIIVDSLRHDTQISLVPKQKYTQLVSTKIPPPIRPLKPSPPPPPLTDIASTMVTLKSSAPENLNIPEQMLQQGEREDVHLGEISDYELCREERIRENRERMQKLGIFDLSHKLTALKPSTNRASRRKAPQLRSPTLPSSPGPVRRSSRCLLCFLSFPFSFLGVCLFRFSLMLVPLFHLPGKLGVCV